MYGLTMPATERDALFDLLRENSIDPERIYDDLTMKPKLTKKTGTWSIRFAPHTGTPARCGSRRRYTTQVLTAESVERYQAATR